MCLEPCKLCPLTNSGLTQRSIDNLFLYLCYMKRDDLLNRIKLKIVNIDPKAEVYLYGSKARGDDRKDSDWDILVITPKEKVTFEFERDLHDQIYDIELESGEVISLLVYSKTDWLRKRTISPLFSNVLKEGIRI